MTPCDGHGSIVGMHVKLVQDVRSERRDMRPSDGQTNRGFTLGTGLLLLASLAATGCQVEMAGQTLPSPYFLSDDVQYYAPGPEFKLAREAAALKEQSEAIESQSQGYGGAHCP